LSSPIGLSALIIFIWDGSVPIISPVVSLYTFVGGFKGVFPVTEGHVSGNVTSDAQLSVKGGGSKTVTSVRSRLHS